VQNAKWLALMSIPCLAHAQAVLTERTLAVTAANEAAMAALERCRKEGHRVAVTVLDHAARTKVALRDDGANPHTVQHSLNKAYTALTYRTASGEYGKRAVESFPGSAQAGIDRIAKGLGG
jgi:uncharacterized protein GlcG (DUF336 family)